jgi:hypothetical protein
MGPFFGAIRILTKFVGGLRAAGMRRERYGNEERADGQKQFPSHVRNRQYVIRRRASRQGNAPGRSLSVLKPIETAGAGWHYEGMRKRSNRPRPKKKDERERHAEGLLLNSLLVSEEKWEKQGLIDSRNSPSQARKKELTSHNR